MAMNLPGGATDDAKKNSESQKKGNEFKESGLAARNAMSDDEKALEGSKRDKVAFVCALGNPMKKQVRVQDGQGKPSYEVVGYKFKLAESMSVPNAPIKKDFKSLVDVEGITEVQAPAGEIVLNLVETGAFISKLEFAGQFTGGEKPVSITAKMSRNRTEPLPTLRLTDPKGSIKVGMDEIATVVGADAEGKGGTPQIKPEYAEKFSVLYEKRSAGRKKGGSAKSKGETSANIAAAFRQLYAKKQG